MVTVTTHDDTLSLDVEGVDKLWTLHSHLDIPMHNVEGVRRAPDQSNGWWKGYRFPGARVPGIVAAGTFHQDGKRVFLDVHDPGRALVFDLKDKRFDQLVVEVDDPDSVVTQVRAALGGDPGGTDGSDAIWLE